VLKADVEIDGRRIFVGPDGQVYDGVETFVTEAQYRKMRQGYLCPWCLQPLSHAYELTCGEWHWGPRNPTQDEWQRYMDETFGGVEWLGPSRETLSTMSTDIWVPESAKEQ
jgi:hypothetical protein